MVAGEFCYFLMQSSVNRGVLRSPVAKSGGYEKLLTCERRSVYHHQ